MIHFSEVNMKKRIIVLSVISLISIIFLVAVYNDKTALAYLKKQDPLYVGQETSYSDPHEESSIYIYRNKEGINVVLMRWRNILGWKMTQIDKISFNDGPSWNYIEIELNGNRVVPLVYGFINDDPNSYRGLRLINEIDNIDRSPYSNLSHRADVRGWYLILNEPSLDPKQFILLDGDSGESIY